MSLPAPDTTQTRKARIIKVFDKKTNESFKVRWFNDYDPRPEDIEQMVSGYQKRKREVVDQEPQGESFTERVQKKEHEFQPAVAESTAPPFARTQEQIVEAEKKAKRERFKQLEPEVLSLVHELDRSYRESGPIREVNLGYQEFQAKYPTFEQDYSRLEQLGIRAKSAGLRDRAVIDEYNRLLEQMRPAIEESNRFVRIASQPEYRKAREAAERGNLVLQEYVKKAPELAALQHEISDEDTWEGLKEGGFLRGLQEHITVQLPKAIAGSAGTLAAQLKKLPIQTNLTTGIRTAAEIVEEIAGRFGTKMERKAGAEEQFAYDLGQGTGSIISAFATAVPATFVGGPAAGIAAGFSTTAMLEGGLAYDEAKKYGLSKSEAANVGLGVGIVNGALEFLPIARFLKKAGIGSQVMSEIRKEIIGRGLGKTIARFAAEQGRDEGLTEFLQELSSLTAETIYKNSEDVPELKEWMERGGYSFLLGAILGGGYGSIGTATTAITERPTPAQMDITAERIEAPEGLKTAGELSGTNLVESISSIIDPQTGEATRGLDVLKPIVAKASTEEVKSALEWARTSEHGFVRRFVGGNLASELRARGIPEYEITGIVERPAAPQPTEPQGTREEAQTAKTIPASPQAALRLKELKEEFEEAKKKGRPFRESEKIFTAENAELFKDSPSLRKQLVSLADEVRVYSQGVQQKQTEKARSVLEKAGVRVGPVQKGLVQFDDPVTGSTLYMELRNVTPKNVEKKLKDSRAKFSPWQMTRENYVAQFPEPERAEKARVHEESVREAVQQGKSVGGNVLAGYPGLKKGVESKVEEKPPVVEEPTREREPLRPKEGEAAPSVSKPQEQVTESVLNKQIEYRDPTSGETIRGEVVSLNLRGEPYGIATKEGKKSLFPRGTNYTVVSEEIKKPSPAKGKTKYSGVEEAEFPILSKIGKGSIVPEWTIDKSGKPKIREEYLEIDPYLLDKTKPTVEEIQRYGQKPGKGGIDQLAADMGFEDAEAFRQKLLEELDRFEKRPRTAEGAPKATRSEIKEAANELDELRGTADFLSFFNRASRETQQEYLRRHNAELVDISSLKPGDKVTMAGETFTVNDTGDFTTPIRLENDITVVPGPGEKLPAEDVEKATTGKVQEEGEPRQRTERVGEVVSDNTTFHTQPNLLSDDDLRGALSRIDTEIEKAKSPVREMFEKRKKELLAEAGVRGIAQRERVKDVLKSGPKNIQEVAIVGEKPAGKVVGEGVGEPYIGRGYSVHFKNEGRSEKTPPFETREEAEESAGFLRLQGATSVRIIQETGKIFPHTTQKSGQKPLPTKLTKEDFQKQLKEHFKNLSEEQLQTAMLSIDAFVKYKSDAMEMAPEEVYAQMFAGVKSGEGIPDNALFQYIGENANLRDDIQENLHYARYLESQGANPEKVRRATGWFRNPYDQKWRFEIQSDNMLLKVPLRELASRQALSREYQLGDIVQYDDLFKAYPQLQNMRVEITDAFEPTIAGSFQPLSSEIVLNRKHLAEQTNTAELRKVLVYEIQHAVQYLEGFARGGNLRRFLPKEYESLMKQQEEAKNEVIRLERIEWVNNGLTEEQTKQYQQAVEKFKEAVRKRNQYESQAMNDYLRVAGEIEARDVEARLNLSREERRNIQPLSSETVSPDQAIVLYGVEETEESRKALTQTPAFKKWFGKSKVVDEQGNPLVVYHGTTFNFDVFSDVGGNPENHHGKAFYFTDSPTDVSENYAGEGPDLTQKIELAAEKIFDEMFEGKESPRWGTPEHKKAMAKAKKRATKQLSGGAPSIIPAYVKIENPVVLDGDNATHFDYTYDEETEQVTGSIVDLYNAVIRVSPEFEFADGQRIWNEVNEAIGNPDFSAREFDDTIRGVGGALEIADDKGNFAVGDFLKRVYQEMGFDGIVLDADKEFGFGRKIGKQMAMDEGTKHYIAFSPTQIKSATGNRGTFDPNDPNITHSISDVRQRLAQAEEERTKLESELAPLIEKQAQLRRELEFANSKEMKEEAAKARKELEGVNKRIGEIRESLSRPLFEEGQQTLFQESGPGNWYYSGLQKILESKMPNKASSDQIRGIIRDAKKEEIEWTGLDDFLKTKSTFTKEEILSYLKENEVRVEEVVKGGRVARPYKDSVGHGWWVVDQHGRKITDKFFDSKNMAEVWIENNERTEGGGTKFSQWVLPGAKEGTYRELLLTLPNTKLQSAGEALATFEAQFKSKPIPQERKAEHERLRQVVADAKASDDRQFTGGHFDEPNVFAHIRFNERTDAEGKKVLFIEEIQSDWAQKGRKEGFQGTKEEIAKAQVEHEEVRKQHRQGSPEYEESLHRLSRLKVGAVPTMPFPKTWHELAFRRAVRWAAENGFDSVAWPTGEQQADRYDLSKQIHQLSWIRNDNGSYDIRGIREHEGIVVQQNDIPEQKLADYIGKEVAQKIIDNKKNTGDLMGGDLKVSAPGMKGFYDKIMVDYANKFGKKFGARVSDVELFDRRGKDNQGFPSFATVHSLPITREMRDSAMRGFPLFQSKKGAVQFLEDGRAIIHAFEQADFSTVMHELGHIFRRHLDPSDLKIAEEWAGVIDGKWTREHEEKFARGFERYLAEGKAPNPGMKGIFEKFKEWMLNVYREIAGSDIDVQLSVEMRGLFDRIFGEESFKISEDILFQEEQKEPIAPTKAQNDKYLHELVESLDDGPVIETLFGRRREGKRVRKRGDRKRPVVSLMKETLAQYVLEGAGRGLRGPKLVEYVRGSLIRELKEGEDYKKYSTSGKLQAAKRLLTENVQRWMKFYIQAQRKMEIDREIEARNLRIAEELRSRLSGSGISEETMTKLLDVSRQFRMTSDGQARFLSAFWSRLSEFARTYGAAGGELVRRMYEGDIERSHLLEKGNEYLDEIREIYDKHDSRIARQNLSREVVNALEDRENAQRHLKNEDAKKVYENARGMLDFFKKLLEQKGYPTTENYFTHIQDVDVLERVLDKVEPSKEKQPNLHQFILANSPFLKPRTGSDMRIEIDVPRVLGRYVRSVTKELAYKDALEYYHTRFARDIPEALKRNSLERSKLYVQGVLNPERGRGRFYRIANRIRTNLYRTFLFNNFKAAVTNTTQVDFGRARWGKEAIRLEMKAWREHSTLSGALRDAVDVASAEIPRYLEIWREEMPKSEMWETLEWYDLFQRSEGRNWARVELGSILNVVTKDPRWEKLSESKSWQEAANEILSEKETFDKAVRQAIVTAAETQVAAAPSMRAEFYDKPMHRLWGMFTAFKFRQLQTLREIMGRQEGIDGTRAQMILRRGLSQEVEPVEVLREVEGTRKAMEEMLKDARKYKQDIGVSYDQGESLIRYLRGQEASLNESIKQIEPGMTGAQKVKWLSKYYAKVFSISLFFQFLWGSLEAWAFDDEEEPTIEEMLWRAMLDLSPGPWYSVNPSNFLKTPVVPDLYRTYQYGKFSERGLAKDIISYGLNVLPFAGIIDRITGRRISRAIVDEIVPPKNQGSGIVAPGRGSRRSLLGGEERTRKSLLED